jgi:hypothetical protein
MTTTEYFCDDLAEHYHLRFEDWDGSTVSVWSFHLAGERTLCSP